VVPDEPPTDRLVAYTPHEPMLVLVSPASEHMKHHELDIGRQFETLEFIREQGTQQLWQHKTRDSRLAGLRSSSPGPVDRQRGTSPHARPLWQSCSRAPL
jgi:hypothetical protein